jgi:3-oxoacyl-[acyl-carrier-protein] synthase III
VKLSDVFIAGLGAYLPESFSAAKAVELGCYDADELERSGWTGAAIAGDLSAPEMAVHAAKIALGRSGHTAPEIDIVLHANSYHQGPDGWSPSHYVQHHTVGGAVPAIEIRQTCNGMLAAMELAVCFLVAFPGRTAALLTGADNFGAPLIDRWRYAAGLRSGRSSILGDAGTAMVLSRRSGFAQLLAIGSASIPELEELYRGDDPIFPPACTTGQELNLGERMARYDERRPGALGRAMARLGAVRTDLAIRTLAEAGVAPGDITRATHVFAGHERYLQQVLEPIGVPAGRGLLEFGRDRGHLGVNDHVAGLDHLVETGQVGPGDHVLMVSNGAGTGLTCGVVKIVGAPTWSGGVEDAASSHQLP